MVNRFFIRYKSLCPRTINKKYIYKMNKIDVLNMQSICRNKSYKIFSGKKNMKMTWTDNLQICENVQQHSYQFIAS